MNHTYDIAWTLAVVSAAAWLRRRARRRAGRRWLAAARGGRLTPAQAFAQPAHDEARALLARALREAGPR